MKRLTFTLLTLLLIGAISCEEPTPAPVPEEPEQEEPTPDPTPEPEPEPEPTPDPDPVPYPVPEATYAFSENLAASIYTLETNGLRNDYMCFYNVITDEALYIDFYAPIDSDHLPSGTYLLGDGSAKTCAADYTYLALVPDGDLQRFSEGRATVIADTEHSSGYVWYHITAYFTLPDGLTVSLDYEGQPQQK